MIYHYGITEQGTYHVEKNIVCQDAHNFKLINENFAIAAVADGLGSESHSDIASQTAVKIAVEYCENNIKDNFGSEEIIKIIKDSFTNALEEINGIAKNNNDSIDEYDTTLVVAVYLNGNLYYGNAGDSGIITLNEDGKYEAITEQQRDEDGHVFPLWFGEDKWAFGYKERVASVLMATDGIYEILFPFLLKGTDEPIYIALAQYLMSEENLNFKSSKQEDVQSKMEQYISSIPGSQVNDDKTILVMVDSKIVPKKLDDEYYKSPNWEELKKKHDEEYRKIAYPHLVKENSESAIIDNENKEKQNEVFDKTSCDLEVVEKLKEQSQKKERDNVLEATFQKIIKKENNENRQNKSRIFKWTITIKKEESNDK